MSEEKIRTAREALEAALFEFHKHCGRCFPDPVAAIECADAIRALAARIPAEPDVDVEGLQRSRTIADEHLRAAIDEARGKP